MTDVAQTQDKQRERNGRGAHDGFSGLMEFNGEQYTSDIPALLGIGFTRNAIAPASTRYAIQRPNFVQSAFANFRLRVCDRRCSARQRMAPMSGSIGHTTYAIPSVPMMPETVALNLLVSRARRKSRLG